MALIGGWIKRCRVNDATPVVWAFPQPRMAGGLSPGTATR